jgi:6-phosphofructokinase 2
MAAVTLGAAGAVLATGEEAVAVQAPSLDAGSAVGAGDAFLAGLLLALRDGDVAGDALRRAVAAGSATLLTRGTDMLTRADADRLLRELSATAV